MDELRPDGGRRTVSGGPLDGSGKTVPLRSWNQQTGLCDVEVSPTCVGMVSAVIHRGEVSFLVSWCWWV
jgi:hypothetical protein